MVTENKHVVFDIVGTCVSYEAFFEAIEARLGDRLRAEGVSPARLFGYAWMETGEKEYTYMSLTGKYVPFFEIFRSIFYRVLGKAGIKKPRAFAADDDREFLLASYRTLRARPGLLECFEKLRTAGYTVWALTSGDTARVAGYLETAGAKFPEENFFSCDSIGIGKPAPSAYQFILDKFPKENLDLWFAAAHIWDAAAAKQCGFKGAWTSVWEGESSPEIYGEMDVTADSLVELAENIVAIAGAKGSTAFDVDGKSYIDFHSMNAVNNMGHGHPKILDAAIKALQQGATVNLAVQSPYYGKLANAFLMSILTTELIIDDVIVYVRGRCLR